MTATLKGRSALVCGASRGIGRGVAIAFARAGADVTLLARNEDSLRATANEIEAECGRAAGILVGDVADPGLAQRAIDDVARRTGRLDILVNNGGGPPPGFIEDHAVEAWESAFHINLLSAVAFTRAALEPMRRNGFGRILNVTSVLGKEPSPAMVLSATMRAGVSAFSKAISSQIIADGITINTVAPAAVFTDRAEQLARATVDREGITLDEAIARSTAALPIRRFATMTEMVGLFVFLASEDAAYITGTTIPVDGGLSKGIF